MATICQITGVGVTRGHHIHRSGKAKKEGGIGRHITKRVKRVILPEGIIEGETHPILMTEDEIRRAS